MLHWSLRRLSKFCASEDSRQGKRSPGRTIYDCTKSKKEALVVDLISGPRVWHFWPCIQHNTCKTSSETSPQMQAPDGYSAMAAFHEVGTTRWRGSGLVFQSPQLVQKLPGLRKGDITALHTGVNLVGEQSLRPKADVTNMAQASTRLLT